MNPSGNGVTLLSDKTYTIIRLLATIWLPALGSAYFGMAQIWGFPAADKVSGTIVVLNLFAGAITGVAQKVYNVTGAKYDGTIGLKTDPENAITTLVVNVPEDLDALTKKQDICLKVTPR